MKTAVMYLFIFMAFFVSASFAQPLEEEVEEQGGFFKATCYCSCQGVYIQSTALYKAEGAFTPGITSERGAIEKCWEQCARDCGGYTQCIEKSEKDCRTCCETYCSEGYGGEQKEFCKESCTSTCSYKGVVRSITDIIYQVAGVLAALMIVIHGIRMVTAQDTADRNSAKNAIVYVVLALIIIVLAGSLVGLFMQSVGSPQGPEAPEGGSGQVPGSECIECGGKDPCWADDCHAAGDCWYSPYGTSGGRCYACSYIDSCEDYDSYPECPDDPCGLPEECVWDPMQAKCSEK